MEESTMKKTYITPNVLVTKLTMGSSLLTGSAQGRNVYTGTNADPSKPTLSRRRHSLWDDEEEDF